MYMANRMTYKIVGKEKKKKKKTTKKLKYLECKLPQKGPIANK